MKRIRVRKLLEEWGESRPEENCNRRYITYREQRQDRRQELQHRVWGVVLWREEELVLACHVVLCRQRELLFGLLVGLYR